MRQRFFVIGLFLSVIAVRLFVSSFSQEVKAAPGDLILTANGALSNGIALSEAFVDLGPKSATWLYNDSEDYLSFVDSTTTKGFQIRMYMSSPDLFMSALSTGNFVYDGGSESQGPIDVNNFKIWAGYSDTAGAVAAPTMGVDDAGATLNIDSVASCFDAQTLGSYTFHASFTNAGNNYYLTMSPDMQTYLTSDVGCKVVGDVDLRRARLLIPQGSATGIYYSTLVIVIVDGS